MKFDPHECTRFFNIEPTEALTKGDVRTGKRPVVPHSSWNLKTKKKPSYNTDEALQTLLDEIWENRRRIKSAVKKHDLRITFVLCVTLTDDNKPFYCLSERTISQIGYFNAPLHIDM